MRTGFEVRLGPGDREWLKAVVGSGNSPQKHVRRARINLVSADVVDAKEIERHTGKSEPTIWRWQERFMQAGVDGLLLTPRAPKPRADLFARVPPASKTR